MQQGYDVSAHVIRPYDQDRGIEVLFDLWTMTKARQCLRCRLFTHPLGWELRRFLGDDLMITEVCKSHGQVLQTADAWKISATERGWMNPII
jgi:hypothetical protein